VNSNYSFKGALRCCALFLLVFSLCNEFFGFDQWLADWIYRLEGARWSLKNAYLLTHVMHVGGRNLSILAALLLILMMVLSFFVKALFSYRKVLLFLLTSIAVSSILVALAKHYLALSCPWEFSNYGGELEYLSRWSQLWVRNGKGCFPAGHASAGYVWISVFFAGHFLKATWRWYSLIVPTVIGLIFGVGQQLRGAHFISDDVWTFAICWMVSVATYRLFFDRIETNNRVNKSNSPL